jgi:hypothetical protein
MGGFGGYGADGCSQGEPFGGSGDSAQGSSPFGGYRGVALLG